MSSLSAFFFFRQKEVDGDRKIAAGKRGAAKRDRQTDLSGKKMARVFYVQGRVTWKIRPITKRSQR